MSFLARTDCRIVTDEARNIPLSLHWMQEINSGLPTTAFLQGTQEWVVAYNICQNKVWGHCLEKMHRQNPCHWILAGADNGTIENNVGAHETVSYTREEMRCPLPLQPLFTRADGCPNSSWQFPGYAIGWWYQIFASPVASRNSSQVSLWHRCTWQHLAALIWNLLPSKSTKTTATEGPSPKNWWQHWNWWHPVESKCYPYQQTSLKPPPT